MRASTVSDDIREATGIHVDVFCKAAAKFELDSQSLHDSGFVILRIHGGLQKVNLFLSPAAEAALRAALTPEVKDAA